MPHWNKAIDRLDDHIEMVIDAHDGKVLTDRTIAELHYLSEVICKLGEAKKHVREADADMAHYAPGMADLGVKRGISVK